MEYAVVKIAGKQHMVTPGQVLEVDKLKTDGKKVLLDDVLLYVNDGKQLIGKPHVSGVSVAMKVLEEKKGDKIRVSKFKAKSRYRKTIGFRAQLTVLEVESINSSKATPKAAK